MTAFLRACWRPSICLAVAATIAANGVYLPYVTHEQADFGGLVLLLGGIAPFVIARTIEKKQGTSDNA